MIRTVITPQQQDVSINLPQEYVGKKVEVIAFAVEEAFNPLPVKDEPITHLASEQSLAKDWLTPQEDSAWEHL